MVNLNFIFSILFFLNSKFLMLLKNKKVEINLGY